MVCKKLKCVARPKMCRILGLEVPMYMLKLNNGVGTVRIQFEACLACWGPKEPAPQADNHEALEGYCTYAITAVIPGDAGQIALACDTWGMPSGLSSPDEHMQHM